LPEFRVIAVAVLLLRVGAARTPYCLIQARRPEHPTAGRTHKGSCSHTAVVSIVWPRSVPLHCALYGMLWRVLWTAARCRSSPGAPDDDPAMAGQHGFSNFSGCRMADQDVNLGRRRFLTATTAVVGGVGGVFAAVPFYKSLLPSDKAKTAGAPVIADISKLEPGQRLAVRWRGQPVWIIRRTPELLAGLASLNGLLADPDSKIDHQPAYAANEMRSIKPEYAVIIGVCTHLGCAPTFFPDMVPQEFDSEWKGGFFCPCHGSRFDLAGRVFKNVPAPTNLRIPPYHFIDDHTIEIGVDPTAEAA
jgi:ubiquinol-cytochrome c reductase iron-sulfur subunit